MTNPFTLLSREQLRIDFNIYIVYFGGKFCHFDMIENSLMISIRAVELWLSVKVSSTISRSFN